jgi:hypothetical protein
MSTAGVEVGYCTPEDVREALQEVDLTGPLDTPFVEAAILAESEYIQETTNRHWYEEGGDPAKLTAVEPRLHSQDEQDIKAGPHAGSSQLFQNSDTGRADPKYPVLHGGGYTRVQLFRRDVSELTELLVRQADGDFIDYVTDTRFTQGRGEDFYLQVNSSTGTSYLYLDVGSLPTLRNYEQGVVATYEYGVDLIPTTVRQAAAARAGAHLIRDDEQVQAIPDDGQLVSVDTKADKLEDRAERLLSIHL